MNTLKKKYFIASLIIAISSQFYIDILLTDFRVTCAVIALGIVLYYYRELHPVLLGITVSASTFIWRTGILVFTTGFDQTIVSGFIPEIFFYMFYGAFFYWLSDHNTVKDANRFFMIIATSDFTANVLEVVIRIIYFNETFYFDILTSLMMVAMIRSSAVWLSINGTRYYQMLIMKEEHEKRYRKLVWLTLILKSEMYWMNKNMDKIEETMTHAYNLFDSIRNNDHPESWADRSVQVASDVHEIKKEYELVMRGVAEITEFKFQDQGMFFKDIMNLLEDKMKNEIRHKELNVILGFDTGHDFYTDKHYQLMSVFRNLIMNAFDAIKQCEGESTIQFNHYDDTDDHVFELMDTGCGIETHDITDIFSPGFSTKINYETGEINRGLGLSLVKDIVEKDFGGILKVASVIDKGTTFTIQIPKHFLEVQEE